MTHIRTRAALASLVLVLSAPALARKPSSVSQLRDLNRTAVSAGFGTSISNLSRVVSKVRHLPGGVGSLRAAYEGALATPDSRSQLSQYLAVRGDRSAVTRLAGPALTQTPRGPVARYLVAGEYRSSRIVDNVVDPVDGKPLLGVYAAPRADVLEAIAKAHAATARTAALPHTKRAEILRSVAQQLQARRAELGQLIALEAGKPLADALTEVDRAASTFTLAAKEATRLRAHTETAPGGLKVRVERVPIGVVSAITPFNFPLNLVAHKVAPAIAAGNPIIIKPSPRTPLTALVLADILLKTAWPKEALSVLTPRTSNIAPLIKDPRVAMVSFTGSETVGWKIKQQASNKRVALELGGNAALVVHKDADLADAVKKSVRGAFAYSGQVCIHTQRIFVEESRYQAFVDEFVKQARQLRVGDPLLPGTQVGPMIDAASVKRTQSWLAEATAGGARVLTGGTARGNFLEPTVVVGAKPTDKIVSEEVFAPVVVITPYKTLDGALAQVNASRFGLQAGIFSKDRTAINQAYRTLQVGGLVVNNVPTVRADAQPYGGVKRSGFGREGPRYAIEEMTEYKTLLTQP
jgi:acyl-CoA reductase-like NAD-dependent aldehyde dehydrogenase